MDNLPPTLALKGIFDDFIVVSSHLFFAFSGLCDLFLIDVSGDPIAQTEVACGT